MTGWTFRCTASARTTSVDVSVHEPQTRDDRRRGAAPAPRVLKRELTLLPVALAD
jgi:hypothetical protein